MKNVLVNQLYGILLNIHKKHGKVRADKSKELIDDLEIYYAVCKFFTLDERALKIVIKKQEMLEEYEMLKKSAVKVFTDKINKFAANFEMMKRTIDESYTSFAYLVNNMDDSDYDLADNIEDLSAKYNFMTMKDIEDSFGFVGTKVGDAAEELCAFINNLTDRLKMRATFGSACRRRLRLQAEKSEAVAKEKEKIQEGIDLRTRLIEEKNRLNQELKSKIKGQDMAVEKFVDSYIRFMTRGKESGKPASVCLFAGPPGTGKTFLAETFSSLIMDEGYEYKRFDMSAYGSNSGDAISGLVGFEPTWRDSQPGMLTNFVKKHPKCVLLFDEIEKASTQVRLLFLSVLEGATLTDRYYDKAVSFENAIMIFTTNEGAELYKNNYNTNLTAMPDSAVLDGLSNSNFPLELLSRFAAGNVIMFNHLDYINKLEIFKSNLEYSIDRLQKNSVSFEFEYDKDVLPKLYLYNKGGHIDARFISSNVRKYTEDEYIAALEYIYNTEQSMESLKKIAVSVDLNDDIRKYFELTQNPRILCFANCEKLSYLNTLSKKVEVDWVNTVEEFEEKLDSCIWNSKSLKDKYSAALISIYEKDEAAEKYIDTQGYKAMLSIKSRHLQLPIMIEENVSRNKEKAIDVDTRKNLSMQGVTDFVDIYSKDFEKTLIKYDFFNKSHRLAKDGKIITADKTYDYDEKNGVLKLCYTNLAIGKGTEDGLRERLLDETYLLDKKPQVRLKDIFGNRLAKEAVKRCIDNIKYPEKYFKAGVKLIKGILMYGAPGMGKTMLAKAIAFESGAAFISTVGSDFIGEEGVKKLAEVFETARRKKPCVIFIDEFDAISKSRGDKSNNDKNNGEMVLNKILKEMDGLETNNNGVYVIGATNYNLEDLDAAVVRRFSSKILFPYPNKGECLEFLDYIIHKKGLDEDISPRAIKTLNLMMYGHMTNYSDIETFIEESISEAVYRDVPVTERFLFNRIHEVTGGIARNDGDIDKLRGTSYHEAGHAVLQWYYGRRNEYVTVVSRGSYGGYAMANSNIFTKKEFLEQIRISLAGRICEVMHYGLGDEFDNEGINIGAHSDLRKATSCAYDYVCRFGFGNRLAVLADRGATRNGYLEEILPENEKQAIWDEVNSILRREWDTTREILTKLWNKVVAIATSLIYMKELDGEAIQRVLETEIPILEESCFENNNYDYTQMSWTIDGEKFVEYYPYGYPIYPRSIIKAVTDTEKNDDASDKTYYYAVKSRTGGLGIWQNLKDAIAVAYQRGAACRRFESLDAANEYLMSLELRVSAINGNQLVKLEVDAFDSIQESVFNATEIKILKDEDINQLRQEADKESITLGEYFVKYMIKKKLVLSDGDFEMIYIIYDQELKDVLLEIWG